MNLIALQNFCHKLKFSNSLQPDGVNHGLDFFLTVLNFGMVARHQIAKIRD